MTDRTELRRLLDEHLKAMGYHDVTESWFGLARAAVKALPALLDALDAAEAALARVRELHERWPIHGDSDHPEDCDCGDPWMTVCRLCCTDGEDQHETCAVYHDHGPDKPICPTIAAIGGES